MGLNHFYFKITAHILHVQSKLIKKINTNKLRSTHSDKDSFPRMQPLADYWRKSISKERVPYRCPKGQKHELC